MSRVYRVETLSFHNRDCREEVVGNRPACSTWRMEMPFLVEAGLNPTSYN